MSDTLLETLALIDSYLWGPWTMWFLAGVAVYFTWDGEQRSMACDRWHKIESNMRALAKSINALRGLDRTVYFSVVPVHPLPPDDFDLRDADVAADIRQAE